MGDYTTVFGSLDNYSKGGVDVINDNPKYYAFSNVYEVASNAAPYEKIAVAKNLEYVVEAIRAEGTSEWRATPHDEFALVMDGQVTVELLDPSTPLVDENAEGSVAVVGDPEGSAMGTIVLGKGHMALLPAGRAYRFTAEIPSVIILQTLAGPDTQFRWADICQTI